MCRLSGNQPVCDAIQLCIYLRRGTTDQPKEGLTKLNFVEVRRILHAVFYILQQRPIHVFDLFNVLSEGLSPKG